MTVDELQVLITANTSALRKEINKTNATINSLKKSADKTQSGVTSAFKKLASGIMAIGIGKIIKDSIVTGMNAIESDSLFDTSLGNMADSVREWSNEISDTLGLNAVAMRKNTGVIYNMTTSMGLAQDNALKMSKGISVLTEDMASFYNLDSSEAFNKLRAGLTGETEPLKALGILVDENTIKQVAYSEGIATVGSELTQQQKVLARYVAILKQTGNAQGDLARTIDSPANQLRILKNQVSQLGLAFGNLLLPVLSAVIPYITAFAKVVTYALNSLAKFLGLTTGSSGLGGVSSDIGDMAGGLGDVSSGFEDANKSAKKLKSTLAGFDEMNTLTDNSDTGSSGGAGGGSAGANIDFDLGDYDAQLNGLSSKADKIAEKMKEIFSTVGDVVKSIWNSEPIQAFAGAVVTTGQFIWDYWSQMGISLLENITLTWSNIELNVSTILTNMSTLWTTFWTDINNGIQTWGQPVIDGVTGVFNSMWVDAVDPAIQTITQAWTDFSGILLEIWNEHGKVLIDNIGEFSTKTIALFQNIWDKVIEPIITPFLETLSWLWDKHLKEMLTQLGGFIGSLINGALEIYNNFIQPLVNFILNILSPAWAKLTSGIIGNLGTILGVITDVIASITKILRGIVNFIRGVFTVNWSLAWNGIKAVFSGIWDGIVALLKGAVNLIIDGINSFISGLNKISFELPDWDVLGDWAGKKMGFNIPKIPKLARGGIIDKPTFAMVGEAGKEAVMPLERNTGWIDQLADRIGDKIGGNGNPIQLTVKLGEDTIFNKFIDYANAKSFETNGEVFAI
jgi:phage-related protein